MHIINGKISIVATVPTVYGIETTLVLTDP